VWLGALEDDHRTPIRFQTIRRRSADDDESHCKNATLWLRPEQTRHRCCACGKRTRKPDGCTARGSKAVTALEYITKRLQIRKEGELSIAIRVKMDGRTLPHGPGLGHLGRGPRGDGSLLAARPSEWLSSGCEGAGEHRWSCACPAAVVLARRGCRARQCHYSGTVSGRHSTTCHARGATSVWKTDAAGRAQLPSRIGRPAGASRT